MVAIRRRLSFWRRALMRSGTKAFVVLALLGTLVGVTVVAVLVWWLDRSLMVTIPVALGVVLVFLAEGSYRIWDETEKKLSDARDALAKREEKSTILENLARQLILGQMCVPVTLWYFKENDPAKYELELEEARDQAQEWAGKVKRFIRDRVGWDEAAVFESDYGLPPQYDGPSSYLATEQDIKHFLARRCLRLEQIMVRLRESD